MLNPIATVKFFGLHALLVGALALVGGAQVHEAMPPLIRNAPPPSTLTIASTGWTSAGATAITLSSGLPSRGRSVTFIAGHMNVKSLASAPWGVDFRTARGKSVLRFERDGRVYLDGQLIDRNPTVVRSLCEWFSALHIGVPRNGRYFTSQPGRGGLDADGSERPDLDGHTYFRGRNGNTLLHLDENGHSENPNRYTAFLVWLYDATATPGDGGSGNLTLIGGTGGAGGNTSTGGNAGAGGAISLRNGE